MKFTFTEKKMDVSDDLRAYAEKKIGKIDKFFKTDSEAFVTFSTERGRAGAIEREIKPYQVASDDAGEEEFKVVRNKKFYIAPMSVDEAILQMNLLEHEFFVFRNADERDAFTVVYRRKNGGYGLITDEKD